MDEFTAALYGAKPTPIPAEYDWFAPLLGDWDFDYFDGPAGARRHVAGEWIFRRILDGAGIEDVFICPSRATRDSDPQPDGEYGLAVRIFNAREKRYDMFYACGKFMTRLEFVKAGGKLVGAVVESPAEKWVFAEINADDFHWQNVTVLSDGTWRVNADVFVRRKKGVVKQN